LSSKFASHSGWLATSGTIPHSYPIRVWNGIFAAGDGRAKKGPEDDISDAETGSRSHLTREMAAKTAFLLSSYQLRVSEDWVVMCGIAGFGSLAAYLPSQKVHTYYDFHSPSPGAVRPDMWESLIEGEARGDYGRAEACQSC
jgi:hypothetical protein